MQNHHHNDNGYFYALKQRFIRAVDCAFIYMLVSVFLAVQMAPNFVGVAYAQQVPDAAAPIANRPTITTNSASKPLINITTPVSGVSNNRYSTFNVNSAGVVVNNSPNATTSVRVGGTQSGNTNLSTSGPANTIVNEVRGAASNLNGTIEVVGTTADMLIANPAGVNCDGCGFYNANMAVVTTGKPVTNGNQVGYQVTDGVTSIGRGGLTSTGHVSVSGRHVLVDGPVSTCPGCFLQILGGTHTTTDTFWGVNTAPITTARQLPYAIDATSFGAMNGGYIRILSTEAGLGVRLIGDLKAKNWVDARSGGDITYKNVETKSNYIYMKGANNVKQIGDVKSGEAYWAVGDSVAILPSTKTSAASYTMIQTNSGVSVGGDLSAINTYFYNSGGDFVNSGIISADSLNFIDSQNNVINKRDKFVTYEGSQWIDPWLTSYKNTFKQWTQSDNPTQIYWGNEYFAWANTPIKDEFLLKGGTLIGGDISVKTTGNIWNLSGTIVGARTVKLDAGLDVLNKPLGEIRKVTVSDGCSAAVNCGSKTLITPSEILAGTDLTIKSGRNIGNESSIMAAYRNVTINSANNINNQDLANSYVTTNNAFGSTTSYSYGSGGDSGWTGWVTNWFETFVANEQKSFAPATIRAVTGNLDIIANGIFVSQGGTVRAGQTATITANNGVNLVGQGVIENKQQLVPTITSYRDVCTANDNEGFCLNWNFNVPVYSDVVVNTQSLEFNPAVIAAKYININGSSLIAKGARIFAEQDLAVNVSGKVVLDSLPDLLKNDTGAITLSLRDTTNLATQALAGGTTLANDYRAYLRSDSTTEALMTVKLLDYGYGMKQVSDHVQSAQLLPNLNNYTSSTAWLAAYTNAQFTREAINKNKWQKDSYGYWKSTYANQNRGVNIVPPEYWWFSETTAGALAEVRPQWNVQFDTNMLNATAFDFAVFDANSKSQTMRSVLSAGRDMLLKSNTSDVVVTGGAFARAERNLGVQAGRDVAVLPLRNVGIANGSTILERQNEFRSGQFWNQTLNGWDVIKTEHIVPTALTSGGDMQISAARDVRNFAGTLMAGGNLIATAGQDVVNDAMRYHYILTGDCGLACGNWVHDYKSAEMLSGSGLILAAGRDIFNKGSNIAGAGSILLDAGRDINLSAVHSRFLSYYYKKNKWYGGKTVIEQYSSPMIESYLSSAYGSITLNAQRDANISAASISAAGAVDVTTKTGDVRLLAEHEESHNYYKKIGFRGLGYGSNTVRHNDFVTSFAEIEGDGISINAGHDIYTTGARLQSTADLIVNAGNSMNFDAHQNHRYYIQSGWWIGLTAPIFSIIGSAFSGGGKAALQTYINQNPLLSSVHALATKQVGGLEGALGVITNGAALINAAGQASAGTANNTVNISDALAKQFNPLAGMNIDLAAGFNAIANQQNPLTALNGCVGKPDGCQLLAGLSLRFTTWNNRRDWTETTISRLTAARDLTLTAGQDINLVGGTIAQAGRDSTLVAGRNVALSAVADLSSSSSTQRGFTFSIKQSGFSIGMDGSDSNSNSKVYSNAILASARDAVIMAGQDIALAGANIRAKNIYLDAGRDLLVSSMQNLSTYNASNFGVGIGVTLGGAVPLPSFSISGGGTTANRLYTDTPTTIIADETLDAVVGRHTILAGSGMWSKTGKLKLDSGDLAFDNFQDSSHYNNWNFNAGFDAAALSSPTPWTALSGGFHRDYKNVNGITFATIGAGDITLRDQQGTANLYNLNRDVASMQRLIRSSSGNFGVPELNLLKVAEDIKGAGRVLNAMLVNIPDDQKARGNQAVDLFQDGIVRGMTREQAVAFSQTAEFQDLVERRNKWEEVALRTGPNSFISSKLAAALTAGENVFFDPTRNAWAVSVDCGTLGASSVLCSVPVSQLRSLTRVDLENMVNDMYTKIESNNLNALQKADKVKEVLGCLIAWNLENGGFAPSSPYSALFAFTTHPKTATYASGAMQGVGEALQEQAASTYHNLFLGSWNDLGYEIAMVAITGGGLGKVGAKAAVKAELSGTIRTIEEAGYKNIATGQFLEQWAVSPTSSISRLINSDKAGIDDRKILEYALNAFHEKGGDKACVFQSALGYNQQNASGLIAQIRSGITAFTPNATKIDNFGTRYAVDIPVTGPNGSAIVRTGWIYDAGSNIPRLTTVYVKK